MEQKHPQSLKFPVYSGWNHEVGEKELTPVSFPYWKRGNSLCVAQQSVSMAQ